MYYSIGEFANLIGVSTATLRLWEKQGKLIPHHRTRGNQRVYAYEQAETYLNNKSEKTDKKEVTLTFGDGLLFNEPMTDLTNDEIDLVIQAAEKIKAERKQK